MGRSLIDWKGILSSGDMDVNSYGRFTLNSHNTESTKGPKALKGPEGCPKSISENSEQANWHESKAAWKPFGHKYALD